MCAGWTSNGMPALRRSSCRRGEAEASTSTEDIVRVFDGELKVSECTGVNCTAPRPVDTDLIRRVGEEAVDSMIAASPLERLECVDKVVGLVV